MTDKKRMPGGILANNDGSDGTAVNLLRAVARFGESHQKMESELGMKRTTLKYHLTKLKRLGLIQRDQSRPYSVYSLTPLGRRWQENLVQSEKQPLSLWRCHAKIIGFTITNWANWRWSAKKAMKNWYFQEEVVKWQDKEWKVHVQSTGTLKVYCPPIYHENPDTAFAVMADMASRIAIKFSELYQMQFSPAYSIREGHKELVGSELLAQLLGKTKIGDVWADASTGTECMEEKEGCDRIELLLKLPEIIAPLPELIVKNTEVMSQFSHQIELHLSVLTEMKDSMKEMRDTMKSIREGVNRS